MNKNNNINQNININEINNANISPECNNKPQRNRPLPNVDISQIILTNMSTDKTIKENEN